MSRGFTCGDGWFRLIDRLSSQIEAECDRLRVEEGWLEAQLPIAVQVKEKIGSLRFYLRPRFHHPCYRNEIIETIYALIEKARAESERTCEECGCPGTKRTVAGVQTLCDECCKKVKSAI